jgi:hypothetical protein
MGWAIARAFEMSAALAVLPLDFLKGGGDSNYDISNPFCHFGNFIIFNRFDDTVHSNHGQSLVPGILSTNSFSLCQLFAALASETMKTRASVLSQTLDCSSI